LNLQRRDLTHIGSQIANKNERVLSAPELPPPNPTPTPTPTPTSGLPLPSEIHNHP